MVRDIFDIDKEFKRFRKEIDNLFEGFSESFGFFGAKNPMVLPKDDFFEEFTSGKEYDIEPARSDFYETDNEIVIRVEIPGVKEDDIKIAVEGNVLKVSAKREIEKKEEKKGIHKIERFSSNFYRSFLLPEYSDLDNINANYENGVLKIKIGKKLKIQGSGVKYIDLNKYKENN
jgi:HSP20 family protein